LRLNEFGRNWEEKNHHGKRKEEKNIQTFDNWSKKGAIDMKAAFGRSKSCYQTSIISRRFARGGGKNQGQPVLPQKRTAR